MSGAVDLNQFVLKPREDRKSGGGGDSAEEQKRLSGDVAQLRKAWANERACPELLPYRADLVDSVKSMVDAQEQEIDSRLAGGGGGGGGSGGGSGGDDITASLKQMDLDRVNYVLASYMRTRLRKVGSSRHHTALHHTALIARRLSERNVFLPPTAQIERYAMYYFTSADDLDLILSEPEKRFLEK